MPKEVKIKLPTIAERLSELKKHSTGTSTFDHPVAGPRTEAYLKALVEEDCPGVQKSHIYEMVVADVAEARKQDKRIPAWVTQKSTWGKHCKRCIPELWLQAFPV